MGKAIPIFNVIMESRKTGLYKDVFRRIQAAYPNFKPQQAMSDFEASMRKGFTSIFPDSKLLGCR